MLYCIRNVVPTYVVVLSATEAWVSSTSIHVPVSKLPQTRWSGTVRLSMSVYASPSYPSIQLHVNEPTVSARSCVSVQLLSYSLAHFQYLYRSLLCQDIHRDRYRHVSQWYLWRCRMNLAKTESVETEIVTPVITVIC